MGVEFSLDQIAGTLTSLGFDCKIEGAQVRATAPYWRSDVKQPVDLIEEVARIIGYDRIPMTMLSDPLPRQNPEPALSLNGRIRQSLVGYGFQEVITYSLTGLEMLSNLVPEPASPEPMPLRVANPMTADQEYLRPNLRANLLAVLSANRRHEDGGIRLFELGKIYLSKEKDLPSEPEVLCGLMSGTRVEKSWLGKNGLFDFYDAKGVVEGLLCHPGVAANFKKGSDEGLHPARQAAIVIEDNSLSIRLGTVGELHPKVADAFEISEPVCIFEINATALLPFTTGHKMFQPIPRFPGIVRDLALIADAETAHQGVHDIIQSFPLVSEVTLFDVYSGEQVAPGKKSLAYRVVYQSPTHTLTDEDVNKVQQQILERLAKELGATLRE
jgi:phenylalanyl-tRNA synthetase beta chain